MWFITAITLGMPRQRISTHENFIEKPTKCFSMEEAQRRNDMESVTPWNMRQELALILESLGKDTKLFWHPKRDSDFFLDS